MTIMTVKFNVKWTEKDGYGYVDKTIKDLFRHAYNGHIDFTYLMKKENVPLYEKL